jgi:microcystin-dependent protein
MPIRFPTSSSSTCFTNWPSGISYNSAVGTITGSTSGVIWTAGYGSETINMSLSSTPATQNSSYFYRRTIDFDPAFFTGETVIFSGFPTISGKSVNGTYIVTGTSYVGSIPSYIIQCSNYAQVSNNFIYNNLNDLGQPDKAWIYSSSNFTWNSIDIPIGTIMQYAGISAPNGWLFCDGSEISTTTYDALFKRMTIQITASTTTGSNTISPSSIANIGVGMPISGPNLPSYYSVINSVNPANVYYGIGLTSAATGTGTNTYRIWPFGIGASTSLFKIPDLRSRIPIGAFGNGMTNSLTSSDRVLGIKGGTENEFISSYGLPTHYHTLTENPHNHYGNTDYETSEHYHPTYMQISFQQPPSIYYGYGLVGNAGGFNHRVIVSGNDYDWPSPPKPPYYPASNPLTADNHKHSLSSMSTDSINAGNYTNSTGGSQTHDNVQPYLPVNYIIKY